VWVMHVVRRSCPGATCCVSCKTLRCYAAWVQPFLHSVPIVCCDFVGPQCCKPPCISSCRRIISGTLLRRYPDNAWEVLLGYDQEKFQGARAGEALVKDLKAVDSMGRTPADDI
jgi:hypothetical protein